MMMGVGFGEMGDLLEARNLELQHAIEEGERREPLVEEARRLQHQRHMRTLHHLLGDVEAALDKLHEGSYGRCDACDKPIDEAELKQDPTTTICPDCRAHPGAA